MSDTTKMSFTLNWSNMECPKISTNLLQCTPSGGFAVVFQSDSSNALGNYINNLGAGLGYDGLSGLLSIEFD
jgi:hypothetical protein